MKFFIDTANLDEVHEAAARGVLDGVSTGRSMMAREGVRREKAIYKHYKKISSLVDGNIAVELQSADLNEIIGEAVKLAGLIPDIVVKAPMTRDGIKAVKWCTENDIRTNCTLVFSAGQALLAAKAGATYVSLFMGGVDDSGWDGRTLIKQVVQLYKVQGFKTQVLAASVRTGHQIVQSAAAGAHACSCSLSAIEALLKHPLTDIGLTKFMEDARHLQLALEEVLV